MFPLFDFSELEGDLDEFDLYDDDDDYDDFDEDGDDDLEDFDEDLYDDEPLPRRTWTVLDPFPCHMHSLAVATL